MFVKQKLTDFIQLVFHGKLFKLNTFIMYLLMKRDLRSFLVSIGTTKSAAAWHFVRIQIGGTWGRTPVPQSIWRLQLLQIILNSRMKTKFN